MLLRLLVTFLKPGFPDVLVHFQRRDLVKRSGQLQASLPNVLHDVDVLLVIQEALVALCIAHARRQQTVNVLHLLKLIEG